MVSRSLALIVLASIAGISSAQTPQFVPGDVILSAYRVIPQPGCGGPLQPFCPIESKLLLYGSDGKFKRDIATLPGLPWHVAVDRSGNVFVAFDFGLNKYDSSGALLQTITSCINRHLTLASDGRIIGSGRSRICAVDASGQTLLGRDTFDLGLAESYAGIDLARDQCTAYYQGPAGLVVWDACQNSVPTQVGPGPRANFATSLRILSDGTFLATYRFFQNGNDVGGVAHLNAAGVPTREYPINSQALALDPDGRSFWAAVFGDEDLVKVDRETGATVVSTRTGYKIRGIAVVGEPRVALEPVAIPTLSYAFVVALSTVLVAIAWLRLR